MSKLSPLSHLPVGVPRNTLHCVDFLHCIALHRIALDWLPRALILHCFSIGAAPRPHTVCNAVWTVYSPHTVRIQSHWPERPRQKRNSNWFWKRALEILQMFPNCTNCTNSFASSFDSSAQMSPKWCGRGKNCFLKLGASCSPT